MHLVEALEERVVTLLAVLLEELGSCAPELPLGGAADEGVPLAQQAERGRIQLLRLDQYLLAHADLTEIVQQAGVADLLQLLAREVDAAERPVAGAIHDLGEPHRVVGHPAAVPERGWIALLDRQDGGRDEALEQALDVLVQPAVLDGYGRLPGQCRDELDGALREGHHWRLAAARRGD